MLRFLFVTVLFSNIALADVPTSQIEEVKYLINYIKNSGCVLSRNGTDYTAKKAIVHIKNKYDYFRDDIESTEDFIEYSATRSTMSGKYYTVTCTGKETVKTQDWLLVELKKIRTK